MIRLLCVHCSATKADMDIGAKEIGQWHAAKGWSMIGYNWVIRRDGRLEKGREEGAILAHAFPFNHNAIAICMVGGLDAAGEPEANFTAAQFATLTNELNRLQAKYPRAELKGHRDLPGVVKDCPCFDVRLWRNTGQVAEPKRKVADERGH